jgi:predicted dehydrogenase
LRGAAAALARSPVALRDAAFPPRDRTIAVALETFVAASRGGAAPSPDLGDGMASLAVVLAAERSAREGIRVAP